MRVEFPVFNVEFWVLNAPGFRTVGMTMGAADTIVRRLSWLRGVAL